MKTPKIHDHLIVRWLERVEGFDLDPVRAAIVKSIPVDLVEWAGRTDAVIPGPKGTRFVVSKGVIKTLLPPRSKQTRREPKK
jgi:hypothetical protein